MQTTLVKKMTMGMSCSNSADGLAIPSMIKLLDAARTNSHSEMYQKWLRECGQQRTWKKWANLSSRDKWELLHLIELQCESVSAYIELDMVDVLERELWSVEHVVPRSTINGSAPGTAEDDPNGWCPATRRQNSLRSNHPLVLWDDDDVKDTGVVKIMNETHWAPPIAQRARLARKWLFIRATYPDQVERPSTAQCAHITDILSNTERVAPSSSEVCANEHLRTKFGWSNPLIGATPSYWLCNPKFVSLIIRP